MTYDDNIEEDENKIKRCLTNIRYDVGKVDKKTARSRTIKHIMGVKDDVFGRGLNSSPNPINLVERLEFLILEPKAGHDGLYDEMLDLSKPLLSMIIINQEQLDIFPFNYSTINMTPVDASKNSDKVRYIRETASQIISTST